MSLESASLVDDGETEFDERPARSSAPSPSTDLAELGNVFHELVGGLCEQIALVDEQWNILAVNDAWSEAAIRYGHAALKPGANYHDYCLAAAARGHSAAASAVAAIGEMNADKRKSARFAYSGAGPGAGREFEICINRLRLAGHVLATVARYDITELAQLRRARQDTGEEMMGERLAERRRMAREIHDSTAQLLACIGLALGQLKRATQRPTQMRLVGELEDLLRATQTEIRSISFLSHPPDLEKLGLIEALRSLAGGFARRTELDIGFHADADFALAGRQEEAAIFRVVQEALSNVHRHARANHADVKLVRRGSFLHAIVADDGTGLPPNAPNGVGLAGMRARLRELDGRLTIRSTTRGTAVVASLRVASEERPALPPLPMLVGEAANAG